MLELKPPSSPSALRRPPNSLPLRRAGEKGVRRAQTGAPRDASGRDRTDVLAAGGARDASPGRDSSPRHPRGGKDARAEVGACRTRVFPLFSPYTNFPCIEGRLFGAACSDPCARGPGPGALEDGAGREHAAGDPSYLESRRVPPPRRRTMAGLLALSLFVLLRRQGFYPLHAAGLPPPRAQVCS